MAIDKDSIRDVFELGQTAVNPEVLINRMSGNLRHRSLQSPATWPTFTFTAQSANNSFVSDSDLLTALEQAGQTYDEIWVDLALPGSDQSLLARLKRPFHQLAQFYVNKLGQKQIRFNDRLLRMIDHLISLNQEKDAEIKQMQEQISSLEARIQAMERDQ